jgi:tRNA(Ile)-lysidine synthase
MVMSPLAERVAATIERRHLLTAGDRVVVGVSAGADSTALWMLLLECAPALGFTLAGAAHLNHGLRGAEADADEVRCRELAAAQGLPIHVELVNVAALAASSRRSIEHAARDARYACFERARVALASTRVATGHTLEDQAETVVLRLARGAGPAGLSGIRWARGSVVRPLLDVRRQALTDYLRGRGLAWREDSSNTDLRFSRNRVRHQAIPALERACSAGVVPALARLAGLAQDEADLLDHLTEAAEGRVARRLPAGTSLDLAQLRAQPLAIRRRLVHRALADAAAGRFVGMSHVASVLDLVAAGRPGGRVSLPGQTAVLVGTASLELRPRAAAHHGVSGEISAAVCHLPVPGVLSVAGTRVEVSPELAVADGWARVAARWGGTTGGDRPAVALVDAEATAGGLGVRFRRPGDRLRPLGMVGHRKLQDLFVDRKVPRGLRDHVPIVVDAHDRIIWVAGHVLSADFRVSPGTTRVLLLQVQRSGGAV